MSDFSTEPVVGHHVSAEVYEPESPLGEILDDVAESYGIPKRDNQRIRITRGDVDWDENKSLSLDLKTFEKMCEWFQSRRGHPLQFYRTTDDDSKNVYVFVNRNGREIRLPPEARVSELQNRI